jgi:HPt (histidine-containing phosphotransfer) domain-containing protein
VSGESCCPDATTLPTAEILDTEEALENLGGDRKLLREITAMFMKEAPIQIGLLRKAIAGGDEERIESSAHKLKGMAAHVGAGRIADEALRIQLAIRKGDREKPASVLQNIERMFEQLRQELSGFDMGKQPDP